MKSEATAGKATGGGPKSRFSRTSNGCISFSSKVAVVVVGVGLGAFGIPFDYIKPCTTASNLDNMKIEESLKTCDDFYVERKGIENILARRASTHGKQYTVVYNSSGVGKSTAVRRVVKDHPGSVWLNFTTFTTTEDAHPLISKKMLGKTEKIDSFVNYDKMWRALQEA